MTALEQACESYFIELLGLNPDLIDIALVHFEVDDEATAPAIVVQAIQKAHRLDGPRGFDVEMSLLYRSTVTASVENGTIANAIRKSIYGATAGQTSSEAAFGYLMILEEEMDGRRDLAKDLKKRLVTVNLIARIEDQ